MTPLLWRRREWSTHYGAFDTSFVEEEEGEESGDDSEEESEEGDDDEPEDFEEDDE